MSAGGSTWRGDDDSHEQVRPAVPPVHYVRETDGPDVVSGRWVPEPAREIRPRPWWRYAIAIGATLAIAAAIVIAALHAGAAAADSFGPLLPAATPTPTPYPGGWTP